MLLGSEEPDRSQLVHGHLAHPSEDVFTAKTDTAARLVGCIFFFAERMTARCPELNEVLAVLFKSVLTARLGLVGALCKHRFVVVVN